MAKVKNKRENHVTKRGTYGYGYGPKNAALAKKSVPDRPAPKRDDFVAERNENIIVGRNPVTEALKSGREIDKLAVSSTEGSMIKILAMAKEKGIPVMKVEKAAMDRIAPGQAHQGVAAYTSPYEYSEI